MFSFDSIYISCNYFLLHFFSKLYTLSNLHFFSKLRLNYFFVIYFFATFIVQGKLLLVTRIMYMFEPIHLCAIYNSYNYFLLIQFTFHSILFYYISSPNFILFQISISSLNLDSITFLLFIFLQLLSYFVLCFQFTFWTFCNSINLNLVCFLIFFC